MSKTAHFFLNLLFIAGSLTAVFSQNQKIKASSVSHFSIIADEFSGYDSFGYSYQIKNNVFSKTKDKEVFEYKNVSLGKINKVDLQNPLKIVLFYEDFNSVVLLDNQLNKVTEINFSLNNTPIVVSAIGMSTQNQLWIFNALNQQISLFDYLKNEYKTVSTPLIETIKYYQTDFNTFYWIDKKNNWFSCDIFGKTTALGKVADFDTIEIINNHQYLFSKANLLYFKDITSTNSNAFSEIEILEKSFDKFYYKDQILSIFTAKEITNYKIVTP
ncbi:hypothetical protein FLA105534_02284 [Flavobacterium bizetiae]|uniref:Glutamine cyclotransferase n=1 Tax=Flavobacterium bizetiae TaxID=2704140 RepID=A0A6J4GID0_9FLAO|nr:hypothetical protein [Flavobacterium bizetiae]CAA9198659.1 hypothetical protein FLA105534_02284 [Flavobacterium bizetiae]CAD5341048.1 hypothetical protein FLA105535_01010 [Flavobacterium bizetiae]CAD5347271.1 hypothetical protein FLA105534_01226 [Flavobacterium bizetiae]